MIIDPVIIERADTTDFGWQPSVVHPQAQAARAASERDRSAPAVETGGALIAPYYPKSGRLGRQLYALETMVRINFLQQ